jgi:hypothetical protein
MTNTTATVIGLILMFVTVAAVFVLPAVLKLKLAKKESHNEWFLFKYELEKELEKLTGLRILFALIVGGGVFMLFGYAVAPVESTFRPNREKTAIYNQAYSDITAGRFVSSGDKLYTYMRRHWHTQNTGYNETWSDYLIRSSRVSRTPDDLGGIVIIDKTVANRRDYRGVGTQKAVSWITVNITIIDARTNTAIAQKRFVNNRPAPQSINESKVFYPKTSEMTKWIDTEWANFLRNRE